MKDEEMLQGPSRSISANIPFFPQEELLTDWGSQRWGPCAPAEEPGMVGYSLGEMSITAQPQTLKLRDEEEANDRDCRGRTTVRDVMTGKKTSRSTCADKSGMSSA